MQLLRSVVAKGAADQEDHYCFLVMPGESPYDSNFVGFMREEDEDDWDRALWERWVGDC